MRPLLCVKSKFTGWCSCQLNIQLHQPPLAFSRLEPQHDTIMAQTYYNATGSSEILRIHLEKLQFKVFSVCLSIEDQSAFVQLRK